MSKNMKTSMGKTVFWQYLIPKHLLSNLFGSLTRSRIIFWKNFLIDWFCKRYQVDLKDAVETNPHQYANFEEFFIRKAKPGARPFPKDKKNKKAKNAIASPVDAKISQIGKINENKLIQAKGRYYSVHELLGGPPSLAQEFAQGAFATLYLSPKDFHRIYMPFEGRLKEMIYLPGRLFSVNPKTTQKVNNLFSRNERVALIFETKAGVMAMVLVGALLVSGIHTAWHGKVTLPRNKKIAVWNYAKEKIILKRGDELGYFTFGSTVILLFQKNKITWQKPNSGINKSVLIGQLLGKANLR